MNTNDTNINPDNVVYRDLSYKIVGLAMDVHNELGPGFLEKVYENALMVLFRENKIQAVQQFPINVFFHGYKVGDYFADILVEESISLSSKLRTE